MSNSTNFALLLTLIAGLALSTAIYHCALFWLYQSERTARRVCIVIVWFSGFYICTVMALRLGLEWETPGFAVLLVALFLENLLGWWTILHDMAGKPLIEPPVLIKPEPKTEKK